MAIRTSKSDEILLPSWEKDMVFNKCIEALQTSGFKKIVPLRNLYEVNARKSSLTLYGGISVTVQENADIGTKITIKSTANSDNIYALFRSPNARIIDTFKTKLNAVLDSDISKDS